SCRKNYDWSLAPFVKNVRPSIPTPLPKRWQLFLAVMGPGIVVMLADTDVGSIITAAQSGAQWGYHLLLLQFLLMPVLFVVQDLTVRLGVFTGKGHGELIRETFGAGWAWVSVIGLAVATIGALLTEFSGVAAVGQLFGVPRGISLALAVAFLLFVVWTGSYRRVERVAIALGLFEFAFFWVAIAAHPRGHDLMTGLVHAPLSSPAYLYLVSANIGAVIMPWMIFYQQSAIADKGLRPEHYRDARWDTAVGAIVTQLVMAAVLVSTAATIGKVNPSASLNTIGDIAHALTPFMGVAMGRLLFSLGVLGAAMISSVVVSLAAAWGFGEVTGYKHSLEHNPLEAPWFYVVFTVGVLAGAVMVATIPNLVALTIWVEVMNAFLLPMVLGFLVVLAMKALPLGHRLSGAYRWIVIGVTALTSGLALYAGLRGM
ncbi:MAG: NRAMP family divalent metal transporter, partial [Acidobacteriaceae bacterium]